MGKNKKGYSEADCKYALSWAKKIMAVRFLGGCCKQCKNDDIFVLEFHHVEKKEKQIARMLRNNSWNKIKDELGKCVLLCRNCHQELHCNKSRGYKRKSKLLKSLGVDRCKICNYKSDNLASFDFHHKDPLLKVFSLSQYFNKNDMYYNLINIDALMLEVEKCDILCRNCHALMHIDRARFDNFKDYIYHKVENYSTHKKLDGERIIKMHNSGMYASQIAKIIGVGRSTVSSFLKRNGCLKYIGASGLEQRWGHFDTKKL